MIEIPETRLEYLDNIYLDPSNPNEMSKEQLSALKESMLKYGAIVPIIINQDNMIIDGHQRKTVAEELGLKQYPCIKINTTEVDAKLLKQILNKLKGVHSVEKDLEEYKFIMQEDPSLDLLKKYVAMDNEYIGNIIREIEHPAGQHTEEELNEVPDIERIKTDIRLGDMFQLGNHYVLCGDSCKKEDVDRLMQGKKADMVFTDPPYGMHLDTNYTKMEFGDRKGKNYPKVIGDNEDFKKDLITTIFDNFSDTKEMFIFGGDYYYNLIPNFKYGNYIVWDKTLESNGDADSNSEFELVWSKNKHKREVLHFNWFRFFGLQSQDIKERIHPTQKPIQILEYIIKKYSQDNNLIVDLFLGSGSTLIACENTGRICYGMEIDPVYCEVICQRWEKLTGKQRMKL